MESIQEICGGGGHVLILTKAGECFSCGWNNKGQLGIGSTNDQNVFKKIEIDVRFKSVACGWESSAGITFDRVLYVWGAGFQAKELLPRRLKVPSDKRVKNVKFGLSFCCILTEDNYIYLFGKSKCINLVKSLEKSYVNLVDGVEFVSCPTTNGVVETICCGQNHFMVLSPSEILTSYGDNRFGQCGLGSGTQIKVKKNVEIKCGWTHNGYLSKGGELFLWGRNNYGQLGEFDGFFTNYFNSL